MNIIYNLIVIFLTITTITGNTNVKAKTVVFPFKVNASENRAFQWMGRGLSLYITLGLQQNSIETFSDTESIFLLKSINIKFPYNISKASILKAAKDMGADRVIWGEITASGTGGNEIINYRSFIIDLNRFHQKYLPVLKGNVTDLFRIEMELLRNILKFTKGSDTEPVFPEIESGHHRYELFIKGLLIEDMKKRISFLEKIKSDKRENSDLLKLELARAYFSVNDFHRSRTSLDSINKNSSLAGEKYLMAGILYYLENEIDNALGSFKKAEEYGHHSSEVNNNIGLIYALKNNYTEALKLIKDSIKAGRSIEAYMNAVNISFLLKNEISAEKYLKSGLLYYPAYEDLLELLPYFINRSNDRYILKNIFGNYIKLKETDNNDRKIYFRIINPFNAADIKYRPLISEPAEDNISDDEFSRIEKELQVNPFDPDFHYRFSKLYLRTGDLIGAGHYAISSLFLEKSVRNYLNLINIYKKQKRNLEVSKLLKEALKLFPGNEELINFSEVSK